ncbi:MAG: hypothetical protein DRJ03_16720 [Chloroflexi bacterium]|nr:MAG: hypothetical protein DRJ03_16720 [Chloroflexota bacterium]
MVTLLLEATLKDVDANPLQNKTINFYYSYDKQTWNLIEAKATDSNGKATTTFNTNQTTYFKASFEGDDEYDPSVAYATYEVPYYEAGLVNMTNMMVILLVIMLVIELIMMLIRMAREK